MVTRRYHNSTCCKHDDPIQQDHFVFHPSLIISLLHCGRNAGSQSVPGCLACLPACLPTWRKAILVYERLANRRINQPLGLLLYMLCIRLTYMARTRKACTICFLHVHSARVIFLPQTPSYHMSVQWTSSSCGQLRQYLRPCGQLKSWSQLAPKKRPARYVSIWGRCFYLAVS